MCKQFSIERKFCDKWMPVNGIRDGPMKYDCKVAAETMARVLFPVEWREAQENPEQAKVRIVEVDEVNTT